ncbi:hypothetical protein [Mycoplana sp. MJR14]|uniref:hypothetical protein n=1 Tax=Mycoplana sp. MJR14 TaxID=3032583 RepID=UPI0023DB7E2E|nr:hypothetical protein [Mycoplana sp. MJR14]MDF1632032.1 hypothetical protein [Mycoplana sp. MJR14]
MSNPKKLNVQLYKTKWKEYEEFDICEDPDLLLIGVGKVVTTYESCETSIHSLLRPLGKDPQFTSFVFQNINSRQSRFKMLEPILTQKATGHKAKTLAALSDIIKRLLALGEERDAVAHSLLVYAGLPGIGKSSYILSPPYYVERKHIGGIPKRFYDITKLVDLANKLIELDNELTAMIHERGERYTKRLMQRGRSAGQKKA